MTVSPLTSDIGREARKERRNNQLYKPPQPRPAPKGKLIELKRKETQTEIKYDLTRNGAEEDHYAQAPERKNTYCKRDNSIR